MATSNESKRTDKALREKISLQLRGDRTKAARARNNIDSAIASLISLEVMENGKDNLAQLRSIREELDWFVKFYSDECIDPESVYVGNKAAFSD